MSDEKPAAPAAPAAFVPLSQVSPAELMKAFVDDGVIEAPAAVAAPPAAVAPSVDDTPALVKIAQRSAALRKQKEEAGPHLDMLKVFSPQEAQRLAAARASGDPVAALAALGFTHSQYVNKLTNTKAEPEPEEKPAGNPEMVTLRQELAALKAERDGEKFQVSRQEVFGKMKEVTKDNPKFASINSLNDHAGIERVLLAYWAEHGALPADTFEESVILAAEVHEADLRKQAERYRPLLTTAPPSVQVALKAPESPRTGSESPRTLTNANTTAPAAARTTVPKTRQEVYEALVRGDDLEANPG